MKQLLAVVLVGVVAVGVSQLGKRVFQPARHPGEHVHAPHGDAPCRIVSLAPSVTEVLFALGLGESVVGVTSRCDYPPEAAKKPRVGDYFDLNYEAVVRLDPDLIVMLPGHETAKRHFSGLGYKILVVQHDTVEGILESIRTLGKVGHADQKAEELIGDIRRRMAAVTMQAGGRDRPRVLMAMGRDVAAGNVDKVCIAGKGLFDELITLAGGDNVFEGNLAYPWVSAEGMVGMDPDVIIDLTGDMTETPLSRKEVAAQWDVLPGSRAVANHRVYVIDDEFAVIPGPRFVLTLEKLARILHGHANGDGQ